jgi:hypothetical protein
MNARNVARNAATDPSLDWRTATGSVNRNAARRSSLRTRPDTDGVAGDFSPDALVCQWEVGADGALICVWWHARCADSAPTARSEPAPNVRVHAVVTPAGEHHHGCQT